MRQLEVERPVLRYFGGKWVLAPWIIEHFPPHRTYVEPFGGGASVLLRKPPSYAEVYNDLDGEIVNVFRVIREQPDELARVLRATPWAREEFLQSREPAQNALEAARRTIARSSMGFADATTVPMHVGFRAVMSQGRPAAKVWASYPDHVASWAERLSGVCIENKDAFAVLEEHDAPTTLFLVEPPYVHSTRASTNNYRHELDDAQHERLCDKLAGLTGMVILCGYDNPIYSRLGWESVKREALADGANERTEVLWINPAAMKGQAQQSLFQRTSEACVKDG